MSCVNKFTGREPTGTDAEMLHQRAIEIWRNPYASPEQLEWAMNVYPEGIAETFDLSNYTAGRQRMKIQHWRMAGGC